MCAIDDAEPCSVYHVTHPRARRNHKCWECSRQIQPGETYQRVKMLYDGQWATSTTCAHCEVAGEWMKAVCGGYLHGDLHQEMWDHWEEGYASILMGRLILGIRRRWNGGADPVIEVERVNAVAELSLARQVVA